MRIRLVTAATALAFAVPAHAQQAGYDGAFVTRLGADTIAIERFERRGDTVRAVVVLRVPRTTLTEYELVLNDDRPASLVATTRDPAEGGVLETTHYTFGADSVRISETRNGDSRVRTAPAPDWSLPFLDMVHWPYELVLRRAAPVAADSQVAMLIQGSRPSPFVVRRTGEGEWSITHPFRGTMTVGAGPAGALHTLDASETTRKLKVERVAALDIAALAIDYARRDTRGASFGPLSGRGESSALIDGATIAVDYGRPSKRGRDIFGALVPFGEVWRTGANEATHFTTDRDLVLGDTRIPAGRYTLFTIPGPEQWTLIVNRRVDIGGTSYDAAHDLAHIHIPVRSLDESVEQFTIEVADEGELRFSWDHTQAYVPIRVAR